MEYFEAIEPAKMHDRPQTSKPPGSRCQTDAHTTQRSPSAPPLRNASKLHFSRLLRRSKTVISRAQDRIRTDRPNAITTRSSVTNMRAPFPLLLPESPSVRPVPDSPELRRMYISYSNLRALAQRQAGLASTASPLLPSPMSKGFPAQTQSYFKFHNPRLRRPVPVPQDDDADKLDFLSYYLESKSNDLTLATTNQAEISSLSDKETLEHDSMSTASESMPSTPVEDELTPTCYSDESDWLANTTSHDERLRRFKARFCQVVQQPWRKGHAIDGEHEVVCLPMVMLYFADMM
jgi:hypothetical protein